MKKVLSIFVLSFLFFTVLSAVPVLTESFEDGIPSTWTLDPESGTGAWVIDGGSDHGPGSAFDGSNAMMFNNYDYSNTISGSFTTSDFDLTSLSTPQLSFFWWNDDSAIDTNQAKIKIYTSTDGTTFNEISEIITAASSGWVNATYVISNDVTSLKFESISDYGSDNTFVDYIVIDEAPTEPAISIVPLNFDFANTILTEESAEKEFVISNSGVGTLEITEIEIIGTNADQFELQSDITFPISLTNDETSTFTAKFLPTEQGEQLAQISFTSNVENSVVEISGYGLAEGVISGIVTDNNAEVVSGAMITINDSTHISGTDGSYEITVLEGTYDIDVKHARYTHLELEDVVITGIITTTQNIQLTSDVIALPYSYGFDLESYLDFPGDHWKEAEGTIGSDNGVVEKSSSWSLDDYRNVTSTSKSAKVNIYGTTTNEWLLTPVFDLGDGSTNYRAIFDLAMTDFGNSNLGVLDPDDKLVVYISTDNGATWSNDNILREWNSTTQIPHEGENVQLNLSDYTGEVRLGFYGESTVTGADLDVFVENFIIEELPAGPALSVAETEFDFADTGITYTSENHETTLNSNGSTTLEITAIEISGANADEFTLAALDLPMTVDAGESTIITTTFNPTTSGEKEATLTITSNGGTSTIALTGTALGLGTISGVITSDNGTLLENANITASSFTTSSDTNGAYSFLIPEGTYTVDFSLNNHQTETETAIIVTEGETTTLNAELVSLIKYPPYIENFEEYLPFAWTESKGQLTTTTELTGTTSSWQADEYLHNTDGDMGANINIYSSTYSLEKYDWLITPAIDLGDGSTNYKLNFDMGITNYNATTPDSMGADDKVIVVISTDSGLSWSIDNALKIVTSENQPNEDGELVSINLSEYSGLVKIGFYTETTEVNKDYDFHIDNVSFIEDTTSPVPVVDVTDIDFGNNPLNMTSEIETITVSNIGGSAFSITDVQISGANADQFTITNTPTYPVDVLDTPVEFNVQFTPTTEGDKTATLTINAYNTTYDVTLAGAGYIPPSGDTIEDPVLITLTDNAYAITDSTTLFNDDYDLPYTDSKDVVYKLVLTEDKVVEASLIGSEYDTKIAVYADSSNVAGWVPNSTNYLYYNDDYTPTRSKSISTEIKNKDSKNTRDPQSFLTGMELSAGSYFIVVDGFNNLYGVYTLSVTLENSTEPVANLTATVNEDDVTLAWEAPTMSPDGYKIYRGSTLLTTTAITELTYTDSDLANGNYTYGVTAVYDDTESDAVTTTASINVEQIIAPTNLEITDNHDGTAILTWELPGQGGNGEGGEFSDNFDGDLSGWGQVIAGDGSLGADSGDTAWHIGTPEVEYQGTSLISDWGFDLDTWIITNPIQANENTQVTFDWNLSHHWQVENNNGELWLKVSTDGTNWTELWHEEDQGEFTNFTWLTTTVDLSAYAGQEIYVALNNVGNDNAQVIVDNFSITSSATRELTGYNVYLNDTLLGTTTEQTYTLTGLTTDNFTVGVEAVYTAGTSEKSELTVSIVSNDVPKITSLEGNYPNPFNPSTTIRFGLNQPEKVSIQIYNVKGQKVKTLLNEDLEAGNHNILWNGNSDSNNPVATGVYFYRMKAGRYTSTKKMILMK